MKRSPFYRAPDPFPQLSAFRKFICLLCVVLVCLLATLVLLFLLPLSKPVKVEPVSLSLVSAAPSPVSPPLSFSEKGKSFSASSLAEEPEEPKASTASWELVLVNGSHPLQEGYVPELSTLEGSGEQFDSRAIGPLEEMLRAMESEGLNPTVCSAYRTQETQEALFQNRIDRFLAEGVNPDEVENLAAQRVARPGTSEHQLGLAADIVSAEYQQLVEEQENTPEQQWLLTHCTEYGFILRYPREKTGLTGVIYEPWHYRYVGEEAAKEITEQGLCLEEYLEQMVSPS